MRSSIACARCRRSKVKCVNNGVGTTCRSCETTGRECTYPSPAVGAGGSIRYEDLSFRTPVHARRPPRPKKSTSSVPGHQTSRDSPHAIIDALDPSVLTPKLWTELFDIFQIHFSTDIPFLHPPTFLKPLRQTSVQAIAGFGESEASLPALPSVLLLAFLALTARFHPQLVAYHSPASSQRPSNPLIASEYYASACRARLAGHSGADGELTEMARTQALLMLGLHEWGMCNGTKAWLAVGVAIRSAQMLGLQFEAELDNQPFARSVALTEEASHLGVNLARRNSVVTRKEDELVEVETKRRIFWSCFILDRYLSSGKYRPQMLHASELKVQLPCSDRAFLFGEKVKTSMIGEGVNDVAGRAQLRNQRKLSIMLAPKHGSPNGDAPSNFGPEIHPKESDDARWEVGADEGVLSRYIKVLDLYGKIMQWSVGGGRRGEQYPPWHPHSTWNSLHQQHVAFRDSLPRDLALNAPNISAHITSRTSTPFALMHTVQLLCGIILHREHVPFVALKCSGPRGPLDPPAFTADQYRVPEQFWENSARELFQSARDTIDLHRICQEWGVLIETPIVGFANYMAALIGVYAINFPWMDLNGHMSKGVSYSNSTVSPGAEVARKGLEIVSHMRKSLKMADGWVSTIRRVHVYFMRAKKQFRRNPKMIAENFAGPVSYNQSPQEGDHGDEQDYNFLERTLKEFGRPEHEDADMLDVQGNDSHGPGSGRDDISTAGSVAQQSESMDTHGATDTSSVRQEKWNAINTVTAAAASSNASTAGNGYNPSSMSAPSPRALHGQLNHAGDRPYQHPFRDVTGGHSPSMSTTGSSPRPATASPFDRATFTPKQHQSHISTPERPYLPEPLSRPMVSSQPVQPAWNSDPTDVIGSETRFSGDDIAAFAAGVGGDEWVRMAKRQGGGGWLCAAWKAAPAAASQ
ncbi:hypothetical protein K490DRAFT_75397 [Saccharata proteae CBS 121410]|uniref:Zn(2)-C6 fungal-type domain-containing protein n=1 Tax=Saccharata proteae CBS 121410 TaxID=1314787 RepID=A0A9P4LWJ4_9PEZI|nr:hypothetical protein K490DRAFT_75397 [Saccharata proteae CBS 121410]